MAFKNTAVTKVIIAWDTVNNVGKTGDAANITVRGVGDGSEYTPAAPNVTEIDSTNWKGAYSVTLAAGENNYHTVALGGKSSTSGVSIFGPQWDNEMNANLVQILATALTETVGGYLTAAFKKLFDVTTPVLTAASVNQTEDNATRLVNLQSRIPAALTANGNIKSSLVEILTTALTETAGQLAGGFKKFFNIGSPAATMDHGILVDTVTANTDMITAGGIRTAVGLASANLDTQLTGLQSDTDDIQTRLPAALTANGNMKSDVLRVAGTVQTAGDLAGLINALNNLSAAQVKAQAVAALATDTYAEPGQGTPSATLDIATKISYMFKFMINKLDQTATLTEIYNNAGSVVDQKATVSDDGTTFVKAKITTGP